MEVHFLLLVSNQDENLHPLSSNNASHVYYEENRLVGLALAATCATKKCARMKLKDN
jgi:hypothetical protein